MKLNFSNGTENNQKSKLYGCFSTYDIDIDMNIIWYIQNSQRKFRMVGIIYCVIWYIFEFAETDCQQFNKEIVHSCKNIW